MLDYITIFPPEDSDYNRAFKFPFMVVEVFCMDSQLFEKIFEDSAFFVKFFSFFQSDGNSTLAGYFSRVFLSLLGKKPEAFLNFLTTLGFVNKLCTMIRFKSIAELITKVIICDFSLYDAYVCDRKELITAVISKLDSFDELEVINAGQVLNEMLIFSNRIESKEEILASVVSKAVIIKIFELCNSQPSANANVALGILKNMMQCSLTEEILNFTDNNEFVFLNSLTQSL